MSRVEEERDEIAADMLFNDSETQMLIDKDIEDGRWPLEISIVGKKEALMQTYRMNENETLALFNLLYSILRRDISKKLEEMKQTDSWEKQTAAYKDLQGHIDSSAED